MIAPMRLALAAPGLLRVASGAFAQGTPRPSAVLPRYRRPCHVSAAALARRRTPDDWLGRIADEAQLEEPQAVDNLIDRVRLAGGGSGIRLREATRLAQLRPDVRRSEMPTRQYSRGRLYATLNYGF